MAIVVPIPILLIDVSLNVSGPNQEYSAAPGYGEIINLSHLGSSTQDGDISITEF